MDAFSDNLARTIILDVLEDIKTSKSKPIRSSATSKTSKLVTSSVATNGPSTGSSGSSNGNTPKRKRKPGNDRTRNGNNETDIDILANRLTSDIISHATYSDSKSKKETRNGIKQSKVETTIPANEYQQAVINYQNHNGFEDEGQLPSRRSSIWNKQPSANSIWNMTDD